MIQGELNQPSDPNWPKLRDQGLLAWPWGEIIAVGLVLSVVAYWEAEAAGTAGEGFNMFFVGIPAIIVFIMALVAGIPLRHRAINDFRLDTIYCGVGALGIISFVIANVGIDVHGRLEELQWLLGLGLFTLGIPGLSALVRRYISYRLLRSHYEPAV